MTNPTLGIEQRLARAVELTGRLRRSAPFPLASLSSAIDLASRAAHHVWRNHRYLTLRKLLNMGLVNLQFALKHEYLLGRPYKMKIESTNICNTHCQLCPTGIGLHGRPKGKMETARLERLIDSFKHHLVALDLSMWGDPLIHPDIYRLIRFAHDRRIWTYISSNLHAYKLTPKPGQPSQAEQLVASGLDLMTCSLHGATQRTYEMYQPGKRLDEVVAKVRQIVQTRDRLGSSTPLLQLNFVVMRQNEHEIEAFRALAEDLGCRPIFNLPSLNARFVEQGHEHPTAPAPESFVTVEAAARQQESPSACRSDSPGNPTPPADTLVGLGLADDLKHAITRERQQQLIERWLPRDPRYRLSSYEDMAQGRYRSKEFNGHKPHFCDWLWRQAVINHDGSVSTCCGSWDQSEDMGNVFETSFARIWNSRKYRMARRTFKRPIPDSEAQNNGCATCPGFMV